MSEFEEDNVEVDGERANREIQTVQSNHNHEVQPLFALRLCVCSDSNSSK